MTNVKLLSVVALTRDIPEHGLVRGQVGTVGEVLKSGVFEVDFSDDTGRTYASLPVRSEDLVPLHRNSMRKSA
jgi:hypothetical protein